MNCAVSAIFGHQPLCVAVEYLFERQHLQKDGAAIVLPWLWDVMRLMTTSTVAVSMARPEQGHVCLLVVQLHSCTLSGRSTNKLTYPAGWRCYVSLSWCVGSCC
jgi:hypothetical protein